MSRSVFFYLITAITVALPLLLVGETHLNVMLSFYMFVPILVKLSSRLLIGELAGASYSIVYLFVLLFFLIAPVVQLKNDPKILINTLPVENTEVILTNVLISIFLLFFYIFYFRKSKRKFTPILSQPESTIFPIFIPLVGASILLAAWAGSQINLGLLIVEREFAEQDQIRLLVVHKFLFMIPFVTAAIYFAIYRRRWGVVFGLFLLGLVIFTKNPFFDRRNAFGPVYFTLIVLVFPVLWSTSRRFFSFALAALIIGFPAASILTHVGLDQWPVLLDPQEVFAQIVLHFQGLHYDAWANFVAAISYVEDEGFGYGRQLLGSAFFFVPRSIWPSKPVSSGQELGEWLSDHHAMWFVNLSCPLPAEGFLDFGLIGVIFFAIVLGSVTRRLDHHIRHGKKIDQISSIYFSIFLIFALRGALLPVTAYGVGAYLAINAVPALSAKAAYWFGIIKKI